MSKRRKGFPSETQVKRGVRVVHGGKELVIARLSPDEGAEALKEPHVKEFDITGRAMKGWVLVAPEGVEDDDQLSGWIQRALGFVGKLPAK